MQNAAADQNENTTGGSRTRRAVIGAVLVAAMTVATVAWETRSAATVDSVAAASEAPAARPQTITTIAPVTTAAVADVAQVESDPVPIPELLAQIEVGTAVIVPQPRVGDLRFDDNADTLPVDYTPPAAATTERDIAYGPDPIQRLDLFLPVNDNAPVIVYLHAGGWVGGHKDALPDMVLRFVEKGYAVASIDYHLAPENPFPAPVHDAKRAIRWIKAYGAETGSIDSERVVIYGSSAGGHLASFVAATDGSYEPEDLPAELEAFDSSVVGIISMVGPVDLETLYEQDHPWARSLTGAFMGCDPCDADHLRTGSTIDNLHADVPPAYWGYGDIDSLIDVDTQARAIADAWAAAAGPAMSYLDVVDGHGHNLDESLVNQRTIEAFVDAVVA